MDKIIYCTVITVNYVKYAHALYQSLNDVRSNTKLYVLVIDADQNMLMTIENRTGFKTVSLEDLQIRNISEMCIYYDAFELCCMLSCCFIKYLLINKKYEKVAWVDADTFFVGDWTSVIKLLDDHVFTLPPHSTTPLPMDGKTPDNLIFIRAGLYNNGIAAFKRCDKAIEILNLMEEYMSVYCFNDQSNGMFVELPFLSFVIFIYSEYFHRLDDPSYNIAYWNLHDRKITFKGDRFFVQGKPACFFHMSGFKEDNPSNISVHQNRYILEDVPVFKIVIEKYMNYLNKSVDIQQQYKYNTANGFILNQFRRRYYFRKRSFRGVFIAEFINNLYKLNSKLFSCKPLTTTIQDILASKLQVSRHS